MIKNLSTGGLFAGLALFFIALVCATYGALDNISHGDGNSAYIAAAVGAGLGAGAVIGDIVVNTRRKKREAEARKAANLRR